MVIFDLVKMQAKTGIANLGLKPTLGLLDPNNTKTLPPSVAACAGLDVLTHAIESYTAIAFNQRPKALRPLLRPTYQGSNPISDTWALEALRLTAKYLTRAVEDPSDDEARGMMLPALVQGTLPQQRVTKLSPMPAGEEELGGLFEDAMTYW